jgi:hypothetical protein
MALRLVLMVRARDGRARRRGGGARCGRPAVTPLRLLRLVLARLAGVARRGRSRRAGGRGGGARGAARRGACLADGGRCRAAAATPDGRQPKQGDRDHANRTSPQLVRLRRNRSPTSGHPTHPRRVSGLNRVRCTRACHERGAQVDDQLPALHELRSDRQSRTLCKPVAAGRRPARALQQECLGSGSEGLLGIVSSYVWHACALPLVRRVAPGFRVVVGGGSTVGVGVVATAGGVRRRW